MTRRLIAALCALVAIPLLLAAPAHAQLSNANVVSSCGTPNTTYSVNATRALTQDTTGVLCTAAGASTVTVTNPFALEATQLLVKADLDALAAAAALPAGILGTNGTSIATSVNPFDVIVRANSAIIGKVGIDQTTPGTTNAVQDIAGTTGGTTPYGLQSAASTNATNVKNAAGVLYGMNLLNTTATVYYLRTYDSSSAPTCSSATNFVRSWPIPPQAATGLVGGIAAALPATGTQFSNGISFCLTGGPTSTDNTNAATGVFVNLDYK